MTGLTFLAELELMYFVIVFLVAGETIHSQFLVIKLAGMASDAFNLLVFVF